MPILSLNLKNIKFGIRIKFDENREQDADCRIYFKALLCGLPLIHLQFTALQKIPRFYRPVEYSVY